MKLSKFKCTILLMGLLLLGFTTQGFSQSEAEAVEAYNSAYESAQEGDFDQAISLYNEAISIAEQAGEEGAEVMEKAEAQLPQIYYQRAAAKYKEFQQDKQASILDEAVEYFSEAADIAEEYNDDRIGERADGVVTQLIYARGVLLYEEEDYEGAMEAMEEVLERNPNSAKAIYQQGLIVDQDDELDEAIELWQEAAEVAEKAGDSETANRANSKIRDELVYRAANKIEDDELESAMEDLQRALEYDENYVSTHYRLAEAYNQMEQYEQALEHANRALELESGGRTDQARIYFEIGTAHKNLENQAEACDAFANAAYGDFRSSAEHEMEYELECESIGENR